MNQKTFLAIETRPNFWKISGERIQPLTTKQLNKLEAQAQGFKLIRVPYANGNQ